MKRFTIVPILVVSFLLGAFTAGYLHYNGHIIIHTLENNNETKQYN